jgi:hypothetical protein
MPEWVPSTIRMFKSRRLRLTGHAARMGEKMIKCRILMGKPERKRPLGRQRLRCVDNIKMDLREIRLHIGGWSPNWVHSARRPLTGLLYLPRVIVRIENLVE